MGEDAVEAGFERELRDLPTAFADGAGVSGERTIRASRTGRPTVG